MNWKTGNNMEATDCSFNSAVISSRQVRQDQCGSLCDRTSRCTHYTYASGTCNLHTGDIFIYNARKSDSSSICGFPNVKSKKPTFSISLIFIHNHNNILKIDNQLTSKDGSLTGSSCLFVTLPYLYDDSATQSIDECVQSCEEFAECSHVEYWDSVCYLFRGPIKKSMAFLTTIKTVWCGIPKKICDAGGCA